MAVTIGTPYVTFQDIIDDLTLTYYIMYYTVAVGAVTSIYIPQLSTLFNITSPPTEADFLASYPNSEAVTTISV
jgi:Na+/citrate or Na+/malate symporter